MIRMIYDADELRGDLIREEVGGGYANLLTDHELETAVLISLLTEARVTEEELRQFNVIPPPIGSYKGGFWGDTYLGESWGSKLWLLRNAKATNTNLQRARVYAEDALQWMVEDGVARSISVASSRGINPEWLCLDIEIVRPDGKPWADKWERRFSDF